MDRYIKAPFDESVIKTLKVATIFILQEQFIQPEMRRIKECMTH